MAVVVFFCLIHSGTILFPLQSQIICAFLIVFLSIIGNSLTRCNRASSFLLQILHFLPSFVLFLKYLGKSIVNILLYFCFRWYFVSYCIEFIVMYLLFISCLISQDLHLDFILLSV